MDLWLKLLLAAADILTCIHIFRFVSLSASPLAGLTTSIFEKFSVTSIFDIVTLYHPTDMLSSNGGCRIVTPAKETMKYNG